VLDGISELQRAHRPFTIAAQVSIWGKRVDAWFNARLGPGPTKEQRQHFESRGCW
jgi:hypothetical protein